MFKRTLNRQLYLSYILITLLALGGIGGYTVSVLKEFYYNRTAADLESRTRLVLHQVSLLFVPLQSAELERLAQVLGQAGIQRVTFILPDGTVVGDSEETSARMDNHAGRPEVMQAMQGATGSSVRFSTTLTANLMYVALPVYGQKSITGIVRLSVPLTVIDDTLSALLWKIAFAGGLIALAATPLSWYVSRRISRPLLTMKDHAEQFAAGSLDSRIRVEGPEDVVTLAEALNQMATQLDDRIRVVTTQRNRQEAILSSMVEGVIAVDSGQNILSLNRAAQNLLDIQGEWTPGKPMAEVIRNKQLQEFVRRTLGADRALDEDFVLIQEESEQYMQAIGTALQDIHQNTIGAVVVLNDITRLKKLEIIRRDFVANVSHELRTPITSIKGFVETILGGGMDRPEDSRRFLEIVADQADRLNAIIEDLLSLSRLEQGHGSAEIVMEESALKPVLELALRVCAAKASEKKVTVELTCPENLTARINPNLFEQAVINLVDNAVKYSQPSTRVRVEGSMNENTVTLAVTDEGRGIEKEHIPRLFERFYRVDKDRSRQMGGTGLGLAIVKHIAQVHGGTVSVDSSIGKGSTFRIHIPAKPMSP